MESCEYKQPVSLESLKGATQKTQGRKKKKKKEDTRETLPHRITGQNVNALPAKSLSCSESIQQLTSKNPRTPSTVDTNISVVSNPYFLSKLLQKGKSLKRLVTLSLVL